MTRATEQPTEAMAGGIAAAAVGCVPVSVRRFPTGARHYVFDVSFTDRPPVVVRVGGRSAQSDMAGAVHLSDVLRPRGVRLPAILASDVRAAFPWMVLERLEGTDLGAVIGGLLDERLDRIAAAVAQAQAITARAIAANGGSAGRYGYAVRPEQASCHAWSDVLEASLGRSRRRIASAGLFDVGLVDVAQGALAAMRDQVDRIASIPFLHDTTTKNVIVTAGGAFSGIVDVDDLCFGDPRYPAALTLAALMAYGGPARYVAAWLRHAEQPDDRVFRLYVALFLLDLMAEHGQTFNGNERASTPSARAALCRAFEDGLECIRT